MNLRAEQIRIRYLYRTLILRGEVRVSRAAARKIIGPDCVYHLYSVGQPYKHEARSQSRSREK